MSTREYLEGQDWRRWDRDLRTNPETAERTYGRARHPHANPYVRWGDTIRIDFGATNTLVTQEFQRIELPRPTLCRIQYHATAVTLAPGSGVDMTAIVYSAGVGSSQAEVRRAYLGQPQVPTPVNPVSGTPLDVEWYVTLERLYARIEARAVNCQITFTILLAPVSLEDLRSGQ